MPHARTGYQGLRNGGEVKRVYTLKDVEEKLGHPATRWDARYAAALYLDAGAFKAWAPRVHQYYHPRLTRLFIRYPHLRRNFDNSTSLCCTVNFGPTTCCYPHVDLNLPFG